MFPRDYFAAGMFPPTYFPPVVRADDEEEEPQPGRHPVGAWKPLEPRPDDDEFLMLFWD